MVWLSFLLCGPRAALSRHNIVFHCLLCDTAGLTTLYLIEEVESNDVVYGHHIVVSVAAASRSGAGVGRGAPSPGAYQLWRHASGDDGAVGRGLGVDRLCASMAPGSRLCRGETRARARPHTTRAFASRQVRVSTVLYQGSVAALCPRLVAWVWHARDHPAHCGQTRPQAYSSAPPPCGLALGSGR
jgi:hypothetical protein